MIFMMKSIIFLSLQLIYRTVLPDYIDLFCLKEPKLENFCGVLFPELTSPQHIYPVSVLAYT